MLSLLAAASLWDGSKITKSDEEWKAQLGQERYCILRKKATERAFSGKWIHCNEPGIYSCAACDLPLFHSSQKTDLPTGWPVFHAPIEQLLVWIKKDYSLPFLRYEVLCRRCDSHLGHVFRSSEDAKLRYVINSLSLRFQRVLSANHPPSERAPLNLEAKRDAPRAPAL